MHLGSLETIQALLSCSPSFSRTSLLDIRTLEHEPVVNCKQKHVNNPNWWDADQFAVYKA